MLLKKKLVSYLNDEYAVVVTVESQCPTGWSTRPKDRSWCYLFVNGSRAKSWNDAKAACEAKKAQLIKVDSTSLKVCGSEITGMT